MGLVMVMDWYVYVAVQNQMQMYPPYFMSGVPQNQRAYFPTVANFRPWQGTPMHGRTFGFVPNQRRAMGGGPRQQMPRPGGQQRIGGRGGIDRMQQPSMPSQQVGVSWDTVYVGSYAG